MNLTDADRNRIYLAVVAHRLVRWEEWSDRCECTCGWWGHDHDAHLRDEIVATLAPEIDPVVGLGEQLTL